MIGAAIRGLRKSLLEAALPIDDINSVRIVLPPSAARVLMRELRPILSYRGRSAPTDAEGWPTAEDGNTMPVKYCGITVEKASG